MKSPFVRFHRFVRSSLPIATLGLCLLSSCRHVPGSRHATHEQLDRSPSVMSDEEIPRVPGYEEPSLAQPINPDASEPPLVSLSEEDVFRLAPPMKPEVVRSEPEITTPPEPAPVTEKEPTPAAESPVVESTTDAKEATEPTVEANPPKREELNSKVEVPKKPAPTLDEFDEEFFPEQKESATDKSAPTEPEAIIEKDSKPTTDTKPEPKAEAQPPVAAKELASLDNNKTDNNKTESEKTATATDLFKPVPRRLSARTTEAAPAVENEVLSLDSYCDGLVFDSQGFGYVSHKERIVRFSPTGETSLWTTLSSPKGHRVEPEGTHLVCDTERRSVLRLSFDGKVIGVVAKECDGAALRSPYDIAVDPKGGFYFSDPGYVQIKNPIGKLHYVDRAGNVSVVVAKIGYPTGIAFDPARQRLLVAESMFNRIVEFRLSEPGRIESHEVLVQLPKLPDSELHLANLCLDAEGNLYVTQQQTKAVHVFDPQGRPIGRFSTGTVGPSSVALRSPDAVELFLTGEAESRTRNGKVIRLNLGK